MPITPGQDHQAQQACAEHLLCTTPGSTPGRVGNNGRSGCQFYPGNTLKTDGKSTLTKRYIPYLLYKFGVLGEKGRGSMAINFFHQDGS